MNCQTATPENMPLQAVAYLAYECNPAKGTRMFQTPPRNKILYIPKNEQVL